MRTNLHLAKADPLKIITEKLHDIFFGKQFRVQIINFVTYKGQYKTRNQDNVAVYHICHKKNIANRLIYAVTLFFTGIRSFIPFDEKVLLLSHLKNNMFCHH